MSLFALRSELLALPSADVRRPSLPMAVVLQEAHELLVLARRPDVRARLSAVGVPDEALAELEPRLVAAREAQSAWALARDPRKSEEVQEREDQGQTLRRRMVAAARWNLRDDRSAQGTLDGIVEGDSLADLIQDLEDLALLMEQRGEAFAADQTFDPAARGAEARTLAAAIRSDVAARRVLAESIDVDLRDRAYTALITRITELRAAGRYAFQDDEKLAPRFASAYVRNTNRRRNRASVDATEALASPAPG